MKMKLLMTVWLITVPFLYVYSADVDLNGPWASKESYEYWKTGEAEEIDATEVEVGKITYLYLTHSVMINQYANPPIFYPIEGGRWELLSIVKENLQRYILKLRSFKNKNAIGELYVNVMKDFSIYFEEGQMTEAFKREFDIAFLTFGENNTYVKCDVKK